MYYFFIYLKVNMMISTENQVEYREKDIYITPKKNHDLTLIWLHGLGDEAKSFLPAFNV